MLLSFVATPPEPARKQTPARISYNIRQENYAYQPQTPATIQRNFQSALLATLRKLRDLRARQTGWDGHNAPAPNGDAIDAAIRWIPQMFATVDSTRYEWRQPYISSDEEGNVSLEWWQGTHKLTLYITPEVVEYLKVWGPHLIDEMEDGDIENTNQVRLLWNWLHV